MDYCKSILGKSLQELTIDDISTFFTEEQDESDILEFKSFASEQGNTNKKLEGVIRGICAFLNSNGGLLIWGAPMGSKPEGRKEAIFVGDLSLVNDLIEKDRLISKVSDSITPLPVGINVATLQTDGGYVYVFEVQKSNYSPHQFKNVYYARLDGQTKPAPHYLVEALFKQITYPQLEAYIGFNKIHSDGRLYFLDISIYVFNFSELQNDEDVSYRVICGEGIFQRSVGGLPDGAYSMGGHQFTHKGHIDVLHYGTPDMCDEIIQFNPQQLLQKGNKVNLVLHFGGKKSPSKSCNYTLDFSKIDWNSQLNPNYLIESKQENILFSELQSEVGSNRESILSDLLKR